MAEAKERISRLRAGHCTLTRRELSMRRVKKISGVGPRRARSSRIHREPCLLFAAGAAVLLGALVVS